MCISDRYCIFGCACSCCLIREADCCVILTAELNAQILLDDKCTFYIYIRYSVVINKDRSMTKSIIESSGIVVCCIVHLFTSQ